MDKRGFSVTRDDETVKVIVPMPLPYNPTPSWLANADLAVIILLPLWIIYAMIMESLRKPEIPPRAVFEIDAEKLRMTLVAHDSGDRTFFEYDRKGIVELRKNSCDTGLWLRVRGVTMDGHLQDMDDELIVALCDELWSIIREFDSESSTNEPAETEKQE